VAGTYKASGHCEGCSSLVENFSASLLLDGSAPNSPGVATQSWTHLETMTCEGSTDSFSSQTSSGSSPAELFLSVDPPSETYAIGIQGSMTFTYISKTGGCGAETQTTETEGGMAQGMENLENLPESASCGAGQDLPAGYDGTELSGSSSCVQSSPTATQTWSLIWRITRNPDRDHDGFPDASDPCPEEKGAPDTNGCASDSPQPQPGGNPFPGGGESPCQEDCEPSQCKRSIRLVLSGNMPAPPATPCLKWFKPKSFTGRPYDPRWHSAGCDYDARAGQVSTAYNEVSASTEPSRVKADRDIIGKCRGWHPKGFPSPEEFFVFYGFEPGNRYPEHFGLAGHGATKPNRATHFLELYGKNGGDYDLTTDKAVEIWEGKKQSYAPMVNIGSRLASRSEAVSTVRALCSGPRAVAYQHGVGTIGMYSNHRDRADQVMPAVYEAIAACLKATSK
jgi:hypothetical protein